MKKIVLKSVAAFSVLASLVLGSCTSDPLTSGTEGGDIEDGVLNGLLEESYTLDSRVNYKLTGSFIVPEGLKLTIPAGTQITADASGADVYLAVLKGGEIDIQGSVANPVIMSSANGEAGDWGGLTLCGEATTSAGINAEAEVGGFKYGGSNDTDSSGSIKNLVIVGTGAQINTESQYNGISFYAVGSGTEVENIAVINGADDGVEFFGGSVSAKNVYLENNEDDAIDWTEGWNGTVENAYVKHTIAGFSTVVEGDKVNNNPKIINLTAVSTVGGTALQFKKESGATITGLSLAGYDKNIDMKDAGALSNVQIDGADADVAASYAAAPTVDPTTWSWIDAELTSEVLLTGNVTADVTLDASKSYLLTSSYIVKSGAKLTIPAGTKITAVAGGADVYIAILQGAQIDIQGTTSEPVVMSSVAANGGDWGGLTICGYATTSAGVGAEAEVGGFIYGGSNDTDNSGSIKNLVLRGTGAQINTESQYNGISFYAVGSATKVENIAVINGADDGVEFFGGTVSVKNIYLENNEDDSIDWTEGWNGTVENSYISHTVSGFSTALEGDKANNNPKFINLTAVSSVDGTALQFKKESGATITGLSLSGYDKNIDMKDNGALSNVQIDGADADTSAAYDAAATVDVSGWSWKSAEL
jgi:molybdopterin-binding protein